MKAVVLVSGGMDSCTVATYAKQKYTEVRAISYGYGSKHQQAELSAAEKVCRALGIVQADRIELPHIFTGSALTDGKPLPLGRNLDEVEGVAPSYVPARNTVFLALAAAVADSWGAEVICFGAHKEDHMGYPDCRPEYVVAMSQALTLGTVNGIHIDSPFIHRYKSEIVQEAHKLGAPLHLTHSCYQGHVPACGVCDTCQIRIHAFQVAGYIDPIPYQIELDWVGCVPFEVSL